METCAMHKFISTKNIYKKQFQIIMQVYTIAIKFTKYMTFSNQNISTDVL